MIGSSHRRSGWAPPTRSATMIVCCTISTMKITSATRTMERPVMSAAPTARRRRRPAGSGRPAGSTVMLSWLAPAAVWNDAHGGHGDARRERRRVETARVHPLALVQRRVRRHEVGRHGVRRGPARRRSRCSWLPNVTPTLDWPSVMRRTTEVWWNDWITCPTRPPAPDDGEADVDAVGAALVERDGGGEVRGVLVLGLRGDGRQRLQEGQVLRAAVSWRSWFFSKPRSACAAPQLPDGLLQLLVLRLQRRRS